MKIIQIINFKFYYFIKVQEFLNISFSMKYRSINSILPTGSPPIDQKFTV